MAVGRKLGSVVSRKEMAVPVSQRELLTWAARAKDAGDATGGHSRAGTPRINTHQALKDGSVLLRLLMRVFPAVDTAVRPHWEVTNAALRRKAGNRYAVAHNWRLIAVCAGQLHLPHEAFDRVGISAGRDRAVLSALALLFFLEQLSRHPRFTAVFSFRPSQPVQHFLPSPDCLASLGRGGAIQSATFTRVELEVGELPRELVDKEWLWKSGAGDPTLAQGVMQGGAAALSPTSPPDQEGQEEEAMIAEGGAARRRGRGKRRPSAASDWQPTSRTSDLGGTKNAGGAALAGRRRTGGSDGTAAGAAAKGREGEERQRAAMLLLPLQAELEQLRSERLELTRQLQSAVERNHSMAETNRSLEERLASVEARARTAAPGIHSKLEEERRDEPPEALQRRLQASESQRQLLMRQVGQRDEPTTVASRHRSPACCVGKRTG
jgi:hypothetical protein